MRKLVLIAAMLMVSASAQAGNFSFNVEGQKVQVNIPRGCSSLSCINVTAPGLADKFKDKDEGTSSSTSAPAPATATAPQAAPTAPIAQAPATAVAPQASKVTLLPAPAADTNATNATAPAVSAPEVAPQPAPVQAETQAPVQVAAAPAAPVAAPAPAAVQTATTPIGLWMSEKKEGKIRIEDCNGNLCGYAVDAKTGANGEKVLINMKPHGNQWAGRIHDTRKGGTYDSTIALRGSDKLKVQGCMMMFCGGETWTRIE
jgi:uncharacterized protein (DUF2147 family)